MKKAGINPAHVDSEEHMESNKAKGWITDEDIAKAKEIIATVSAEKAANLPQQMIENIAKGRLGKFLKEVCLLNQEDIMDGKKTVREVLKEADPELQSLLSNVSLYVLNKIFRNYRMGDCVTTVPFFFPVNLVWVYPSAFNNSMTRCLNSPWIRISRLLLNRLLHICFSIIYPTLSGHFLFR